MTDEQIRSHLKNCQDKCDLKIGSVVDDVRELKECVYGEKGIKTRVITMENELKHVVDAKNRATAAIVAVFVAMLVTVIGALASMYISVRTQEQGLSEIKHMISARANP